MVIKKTVLAILDGFGLGENNPEENAIYKAHTPMLNQLMQEYGYAKLQASEEAVGLEKHQFGNSEVGHLTVGCGHAILGINQLMNQLIEQKELESVLLQQDWVQKVIQENKVIHLAGLYSSGGVHANAKHMDALIKFFEKHNVRVGLHLFSDGRDTAKFVFLEDVKKLLSNIKDTTKILSVAGRYYAMDRDQNWDRTKLAYQAMNQLNHDCESVLDYIQDQYDHNHDDEFIVPYSFNRYPEYLLKNDDVICFTNYRTDRIRQIIHAFKKLGQYNVDSYSDLDLTIVGLCEYSGLKTDEIILEKPEITNTLGEVLEEHHIKQLRVAETEKYAHVTYFFDGGKLIKQQNRIDILVNSPKVATYDLKPEMSATEITDVVLEQIDKVDVVVLNYANADMVGHTGNFEATVKAVEFLDSQIAKLYNTIVRKYHGNLLITADHGNADCMKKDHQVVKTHTVSEVPFIVASEEFSLAEHHGTLQDIAPSLLYLLGIEAPISMTGHNLLKRN